MPWIRVGSHIAEAFEAFSPFLHYQIPHSHSEVSHLHRYLHPPAPSKFHLPLLCRLHRGEQADGMRWAPGLICGEMLFLDPFMNPGEGGNWGARRGQQEDKDGFCILQLCICALWAAINLAWCCPTVPPSQLQLFVDASSTPSFCPPVFAYIWEALLTMHIHCETLHLILVYWNVSCRTICQVHFLWTPLALGVVKSLAHRRKCRLFLKRKVDIVLWRTLVRDQDNGRWHASMPFCFVLWCTMSEGERECTEIQEWVDDEWRCHNPWHQWKVIIEKIILH